MSTQKLTQSDIDEMRRLRAEGMSTKELAALFDVHPVTVNHWSHVYVPKPSEPNRDELLLSAFPWAYTLPPAAREQFAHELAHRPKYEFERDLDQFITQWHHRAEKRAS